MLLLFINNIISSATVFAGVPFVHQSGTNHAPGALVTQVTLICHIPCISSSSSRSLYLLFFSISFSAMFLSDGIVISISLLVEFTESLTMNSGLFFDIVLSLWTGMSHMMVMLLS